jgi:hypothetical protein
MCAKQVGLSSLQHDSAIRKPLPEFGWTKMDATIEPSHVHSYCYIVCLETAQSLCHSNYISLLVVIVVRIEKVLVHFVPILVVPEFIVLVLIEFTEELVFSNALSCVSL